MFSPSLRLSFLVRISGTLLFLGLVCGASPALGQHWHRTARVAAPVEEGDIRAFLDTVLHKIDERDLRVRRAPERTGRPSLSALRSALMEEHEIGIRAANTAVIEYEFRMDAGDYLQREIRNLQFQLQSPSSDLYVNILYIDARQPWVQDLLSNNGIHAPANEAALIPFRQRLQFSKPIQNHPTWIVELGGEVIRDDFASKKMAFVRKIEQLTYGGPFAVADPLSEEYVVRRVNEKIRNRPPEDALRAN